MSDPSANLVRCVRTILQGPGGPPEAAKYKINGTATTAIEKSNPNRPAKSRLPYSYQEHEQVRVVRGDSFQGSFAQSPAISAAGSPSGPPSPP